MRKIYLLIFIASLLFGDYKPENKLEIYISNGVFVGQKEPYIYFEIEAYGIYVEKHYQKSDWKLLDIYRDYLDYRSFLRENLDLVFKYLPKERITPILEKEKERLEKERLAQLEKEKIVEEIVKWSRKYNLGLPETYDELMKVEGIIAQGSSLITKAEFAKWEENKGKNLDRYFFADTSKNQIKEIPNSIGNLTNLKELYLSNNQIKEIPNSIGNLTNLEWLYLENNQIPYSERNRIKTLLPKTKLHF
jgi:hypothetical protein